METTDNTRQTRDLVTRYLQSVSRDVRYLGSDKDARYHNGCSGRQRLPIENQRTVEFEGAKFKFVGCRFCRDKVSTFVKAKDYHSDARNTIVESEDSYYEVWTDYKTFSPIKDFAYLSSGDIIRINSKKTVKLLCDPYIVGYRYKVTVSPVKKEDL